MAKSYTIHDLPQEERPRERLRRVGVENLSIQELLTLIIERGGTAPDGKGRSVLTIAQNLLAHFGNLEKIKGASIEELRKIKGVGFATACKLQAAFKIGERALSHHKTYGQKIGTPEDVFNLLKDKIGNKKKEHFVALSLNSRNCLISIDEVSVGTLNANLAHPREIFASAIKNSAASVILVHNHPSGETEPSKKDIELTKQFVGAGELLGIGVIDHIIVAKDKFLSMKEKRMLS